MDGWKRFQRLARVKCPSASWNAPTMRNPVGRIRNIRAKMKKGTTPSQAQDMRPRDMRPGSLGAADTAGILPTLVTIAATARQGHAAEEVVPPSAPCGRACRARPLTKDAAYFTFAPTTVSHCFVMTPFDWSCWSRVGKTAFSYAAAGGNFARTSAGTLLFFTRSWKRMGWQYPFSQPTWPSSE